MGSPGCRSVPHKRLTISMIRYTTPWDTAAYGPASAHGWNAAWFTGPEVSAGLAGTAGLQYDGAERLQGVGTPIEPRGVFDRGGVWPNIDQGPTIAVVEGGRFDESLQAALHRCWGLEFPYAAAIRILRLFSDGSLPPVEFPGQITQGDRTNIEKLTQDIRLSALVSLESADLITRSDSESTTFACTAAGVRAGRRLQTQSEKLWTDTVFRMLAARDMLLAGAYTSKPEDKSCATAEELLRNTRGTWDWRQDEWRSKPRRGTQVYDKVSGARWISLRTTFGKTTLQPHVPPPWYQFAGDVMRHNEFIAAEEYLCRHDLLSQGRCTIRGDTCIEDFGGSVRQYRQHRTRTEEQKRMIMVDSKYSFTNAHFHGSAQIGDRGTQLNSQTATRTGNAPAVKVADLAALHAALQGHGSDEALALAAELLKLQQSAVANFGELPAEKATEAAHSRLWERIREVLGDVAGSAISGVLKALLGIG